LAPITQQQNMAAVAWSPAGNLIGGGSYEGMVYLWDAASGNLVMSHQGNSRIVGLAWSPDGQTLVACAADKGARVGRTKPGQPYVELRGHERDGNLQAAWSSDGSLVATAGADATVRTWEAATGKNVTIMREPWGKLHNIVWPADDRTLRALGEDQIV